MEGALSIPELRYRICEDCTPRTLYALAQTCHDFLEPALDSLWESSPDFTTLLRSISYGAWREFGTNDMDSSRQWSLVRSLTSLEYARFRFYSRRIRNISVNLDISSGSGRFLDLLVDIVASGSPTPFPCLKVLKFGSPDARAGDVPTAQLLWWLFPMFLSTSLVEIRLRFSIPQRMPWDLSPLVVLPQRCPHLRVLSIKLDHPTTSLYGPVPINEVLREVSRCVLQLVHLKELESPCLTDKALESISSVKKLYISAHYVHYPGFMFQFPSSLSSHALSKVETLSLDAFPPYCRSLLLAAGWRSLVDVSFRFEWRSEPDSVVDIFACLGGPQLSQQLRNLTLSGYVELEGGFTVDQIRPLSNCIALRRFRFDLPCVLLDDDFRELISGFSMLTELSLPFNSLHGDMSPSSFDIHTMEFIVENCPELSTFFIPFDITDIPSEEYRGPVCPFVRCLAVDGWILESNSDCQEDVAIYLLCLFPNLTELNFNHDEKKLCDRWDKISNMLGLISRARRCYIHALD